MILIFIPPYYYYYLSELLISPTRFDNFLVVIATNHAPSLFNCQFSSNRKNIVPITLPIID